MLETYSTREAAEAACTELNYKTWAEEIERSGHPQSCGCDVYELGPDVFVVGPAGDNWLTELQAEYHRLLDLD